MPTSHEAMPTSHEAMPTSHPESLALPSEPIGYQRYDNEGHDDDFFRVLAPRVLASLWRGRYFVAAFCAVGVLVGGLVAISMANQYTSEVVLVARFTQEDPRDPQLLSDIFLDAASTLSVVQTELYLIHSDDIAERVVTSLDLANDPNFAKSLLDRPTSPNSSPNRLIAAELLKNLKVSNDPRSMLIRISYTSPSPEQSARIANAFAEEYLRTRIELAARRRLMTLSATYGPKHPTVLKAKSDLDEVLRGPRLSVSERAQILSWASPPILKSGPDRKLIVGVAFICSLAAGIILVLLFEQAKQVFRSVAETDQERIAQEKGA
jgi:uncharacterized protein involved in exopolysaccharide biosynthesis